MVSHCAVHALPLPHKPLLVQPDASCRPSLLRLEHEQGVGEVVHAFHGGELGGLDGDPRGDHFHSAGGVAQGGVGDGHRVEVRALALFHRQAEAPRARRDPVLDGPAGHVASWRDGRMGGMGGDFDMFFGGCMMGVCCGFRFGQ